MFLYNGGSKIWLFHYSRNDCTKFYHGIYKYFERILRSWRNVTSSASSMYYAWQNNGLVRKVCDKYKLILCMRLCYKKNWLSDFCEECIAISIIRNFHTYFERKSAHLCKSFFARKCVLYTYSDIYIIHFTIIACKLDGVFRNYVVAFFLNSYSISWNVTTL